MSGNARVVVGVDFTECSRAALAQAVRLSGAGADVLAVHVVERSLIEQVGASLEAAADSVRERVIGHTRYGLERMVAEIPDGKDVRLEVVAGSAAGELVRIARDSKAELLVLGSVGQGHSGGKTGVGTTAGRCVRHGPTDVLLVRPEATGPFKRIVACVDFSDTSARALREAVKLAHRDGAAVEAVHVFAPPPPAYPPTDAIGLWPIPAPDYAELSATLRESAATALAQLVASLGAAAKGVEIRTSVVDDTSYARGICEFASRKNADLVVLGTLGRTGLRYLLLGSTAEKVLRDVGCSVLAVKPHEGAHA
jgi:universal stress protein E